MTRERAIEAAAKAMHLWAEHWFDGEDEPRRSEVCGLGNTVCPIPESEGRAAPMVLDAICSTLADNEYLSKDGTVVRAERLPELSTSAYTVPGPPSYRLVPVEGSGRAE